MPRSIAPRRAVAIAWNRRPAAPRPDPRRVGPPFDRAAAGTLDSRRETSPASFPASFLRVADLGFSRCGGLGGPLGRPLKKNYVLDTNVLLHDPRALFQFKENNVI